MKELVFDIDDLRITAKTWGNPKGTPVLAIHGWLDNANTFVKVASSLLPDIYLVAIDLPGHGFSDHRRANSSYYLWDYAIDLLSIIEKLGWKKIMIIAHSMGTGIASILAGAIPEMINKLVFIDGLGAPFVVKEENIVSSFKKSIQQLKMARKTQLYGFSSPETVQFISKEEAIKDRQNSSIAPISYEASDCLVQRSLKEVTGGYRWTYDPRIILPECYKMTESQAQLFISNISCETLVVLGKQGLFNQGHFQDRIDKFHNAKIYWLEGGHHLHLEDASEEIATLINQFLEVKQITLNA